jgi:uncharacterized protein (TIGR03792 family)
MKVEKLIFQVRPSGFSNKFIELDEIIWNPWLKSQRGYLGKTFRVVPRSDHEEVTVSVLWKSPEDLKRASMRKEEIASLNRRLSSSFPAQQRLVRSIII